MRNLVEARFAHDSTTIPQGLACAQIRLRAPREPDKTMTEALGIHELWLFILSGLLLNVTPGPDTAYIIGRSIQFGWRGGVAGASGSVPGCVVHVFGPAIGLVAVLVAASTALPVL